MVAAFASTVTFTGADVCAEFVAVNAKLAIATANQIVLRKVRIAVPLSISYDCKITQMENE